MSFFGLMMELLLEVERGCVEEGRGGKGREDVGVLIGLMEVGKGILFCFCGVWVVFWYFFLICVMIVLFLFVICWGNLVEWMILYVLYILIDYEFVLIFCVNLEVFFFGVENNVDFWGFLFVVFVYFVNIGFMILVFCLIKIILYVFFVFF